MRKVYEWPVRTSKWSFLNQGFSTFSSLRVVPWSSENDAKSSMLADTVMS